MHTICIPTIFVVSCCSKTASAKIFVNFTDRSQYVKLNNDYFFSFRGKSINRKERKIALWTPSFVWLKMRANCILTTCVKVSILNYWVNLYLSMCVRVFTDMVAYCICASLAISFVRCLFTRDNHYVEHFRNAAGLQCRMRCCEHSM